MIFTNTWLVFRWCLAGFLYFGAITESGMKGALYSWNREIKFHSEVMVLPELFIWIEWIGLLSIMSLHTLTGLQGQLITDNMIHDNQTTML